MKTSVAVFAALLLGACALGVLGQGIPAGQDWTHYVRIGAYGLKGGDATEIVRRAQESGVFGIEVDNDIPGRYESFILPAEKLAAIRAVAQEAHRVGNHAFVYIAGTECITAHGDQTAHTMAKDHPDWLQRKITGEPAIFGGGTAFWIKKVMKTFGSARMQRNGARSTWNAFGRSREPASTAFTSTFRTG